VVAIKAKIAYSLAAIESFGKFKGSPGPENRPHRCGVSR
jgi:hypothetical protein